MTEELRNQKPTIVNVEQPVVNVTTPDVTVNIPEQKAPVVNVQPFNYEQFSVSMAAALRPVLEPIGRAMATFGAVTEKFSAGIGALSATMPWKRRHDIQTLKRDEQGRVSGSETDVEYRE
jgi:hypothetical protein